MPEAPQQPLTPPDMQGAGMPQPQPQGGIIDAMRSLGGTPMAPPPQANLGTAFGSGVLNPGGANPYLQDLQKQGASQFYQQLNLQRFQEQKRQNEIRNMQADMTLQKGLLEMLPEGPARDMVAKRYAGDYSRLSGNPNAGPLAAAIATKQVDAATVDGVIKAGADKIDPALIAARFNITPAQVQKILSLDPKTVERLGAESAQARETRAVEAKIKAAELLEKEQGAKLPLELKRGSPEFVERAMAIHRRQNGGQEFQDGTPESRSKASEAAIAAIEARQDARDRAKADASLERALTLLGAKQQTASATAAAKPRTMTPAQESKELERWKQYDKILMSIQELRKIMPELNKLGALSQGDDWFSQSKADANVALFARSNDAVKNFKLLWPAFEIGQVSRGYFDEKNARQKQAFEEQLGIVSHMPTLKAMTRYLDMMEGLTVDQMRKGLSEYETRKMPETLINSARDVYEPWSQVKPLGKADQIPAPKQTIDQRAYQILRSKGATDEQIRDKYDVVGVK